MTISEAGSKSNSPRGIARTSPSLPMTATIVQAVTRTTPMWITTPSMDSPSKCQPYRGSW